MIAERDENYRLICAKRGSAWWVEMRAGPFWVVGDPSEDFDTAIQNARGKFEIEHGNRKPQNAEPVIAPVIKSDTDLSDLFI